MKKEWMLSDNSAFFITKILSRFGAHEREWLDPLHTSFSINLTSESWHPCYSSHEPWTDHHLLWTPWWICGRDSWRLMWGHWTCSFAQPWLKTRPSKMMCAHKDKLPGCVLQMLYFCWWKWVASILVVTAGVFGDSFLGVAVLKRLSRKPCLYVLCKCHFEEVIVKTWLLRGLHQSCLMSKQVLFKRNKEQGSWWLCHVSVRGSRSLT